MPGVSNNSQATAQNIDAAFIALGASAQRAAVLSSIPEPSGFRATTPAFAFEDISATGTVIAGLTGQDNVSVSIPIGFTFPFYGVNNSSVFVSTNGLLTFGGAFTGANNSDLTGSPPLAAIAPLWDNLGVLGTANSRVRYQVLGSGPSLPTSSRSGSPDWPHSE